jgi:hypothetical protein
MNERRKERVEKYRRIKEQGIGNRIMNSLTNKLMKF